MTEPRFWWDDAPHNAPAEHLVAINDDAEGGTIAYALSTEHATEIVDGLKALAFYGRRYLRME